MPHHAADGIGVREHSIGFVDLPRGDQLPYARTGNRLAIDNHRFDNFQRNGGRVAQLSQHLDVAGPIVAEEKIAAFDHRPGLERIAHDALEELIGRKPQQRFVGRIGDGRIDAQFGQQFRFAVGPRQRGRRFFGAQQSHGMRIEREHDGRAAYAARFGQQSLYDLRVPHVHAVEVADRHGAAANRIRQCFQIAK